MSLDQTHYDVAVLSTGLSQSILSAALSAAGLSVIHLDENDYYADQWASLTLTELQRWCKRQGKKRVRDAELSYAAADDIPAEMLALDRHYAISLAPTLLPATGPSIDTLIASQVSSYATFRLLEQTAVYTPSESAGTSLAAVPASKEDIFKTKDISLIDKRKLMKLLLLIASDDWGLDEATAQQPFVSYLTEVHKLSPDLVKAVAYGVSLCATPHDRTLEAMTRARSHLKSTGRYGNSAYLVGQYGGAGELAQGYCRASAVKGGVFILDHEIKSAQRLDQSWSIDVAGIDEQITASYLVSGDELLDKISANPLQSGKQQQGTHRGVLVLDSSVDFRSHMKQQEADSPPQETGLIVFPPGSIADNKNAVLVLMMGEGTFSCPKGQYVYYIQTQASEDTPSTAVVLQPVIDEILRLASRPDTPAIKPLLQLTYLQVNTAAAQTSHPELNLASVAFPPFTENKASASMVSMTDAAVHVAQDIFYTIVASRLPDSEGSHAEKLQKVKQAVLDRSRRRRKRDSAEYQGRGGRGSDDGVTKEPDEATLSTVDESSQSMDVVGFFDATQDDDE